MDSLRIHRICHKLKNTRGYSFCELYLWRADNASAQRRRPKVVTSGDKFSSLPKKKVDYDYHEYEYPSQNTHPVVEDSGENEQQVLRETYIHSKPSKKPGPGFSAGSGLRSIAQGSADQVMEFLWDVSIKIDSKRG